MMITVFVVLALLAFLVGTINKPIPAGSPINWISAGLALLTLAYLVSTRG